MSNTTTAKNAPSTRTRAARALKPPPSPWIIAITTDASKKLAIAPGSRVAVRKAREGGYRVVTKQRTVLIGEAFFDTYLVYLRDTENDLVFPSSQSAVEELLRAHFLRASRSN